MNIEFVNANVSGEMAQLMILNQERYVPAISTGHGKKEITSQVPMHGDQLFEERARNVQWTFRVGNDAFERLEGLTTEFADWHAKVTLYKVCEAYSYKTQGGTPYNGLYREAPPERGTFFTLQVCKRVGISKVEVYKRVGKLLI